MQEELKKLFIQICEALGMQQNDPLMYAYVNDRIDQIQKDFLVIFYEILKELPYIATDSYTKQNWLDNVHIQAIHIFSEFLKAITATRPLQKNVSIKPDSERYKMLQERIKYLALYANTIKSEKGNLSIAELENLKKQYKDEDYMLRNHPDFIKIIRLIFKKNISAVNAKARSQHPGAEKTFIVKITKKTLDASESFLMSLSNRTVFGYSEELMNTIKENINFPEGQAIDPKMQGIFFQVLKRHLAATKKAENIDGIIQLMEALKIKNLNDLILLDRKKNALFTQILSSINTRPKLSETDKNNLAEEPILLFNVLMKLTLDNALENLDDGALEKGYKDKYFSNNGMVFPSKKLRTMYASVLNTLDYKLHANNQQYIAIQKDQFETAKIYKAILRDLVDYANFVQTAASEAMAANAHNKNHKLAVYLNELQGISRQLSSVVIADDAKITKTMGHTIIKFTESVMAISHKVRDEINITSQSKAQRFSEKNLGFLGKILNAISRLCQMLLATLCCFRQRTEAPERIATPEGESKRQKVIQKIQKMRF